ncbi:MAG TPA: hypothetical protein VM012_03165 [Flavitalea sp.]|nr:hypothetical protein [Flavitalea sp.]
MKLDVLFAKYLYQNKQLNLPGIGTFQLDASVPIPDPSDKNTVDLGQHIRFIQQPIAKPDDAFIDFIRTQTGKIRPLAISDLESYLEDGKNMLNIGKPFHLEGIGSLHKTRADLLEFKAGEPLLERMEMSNDGENEQYRRNKTAYEERYNSASQNTGLRKLLITMGVLIGIAAVIWGGYSLYNNKTSDDNVIEKDAVGTAPPVINTDSIENARKDSLDRIAAAESNSGTYKFIVERTDMKARAVKRFNQLKSLGTSILMETSDSVNFKLYYLIPAQPKDTIRIKDSLRLRYGKRVTVEK